MDMFSKVPSTPGVFFFIGLLIISIVVLAAIGPVESLIFFIVGLFLVDILGTNVEENND